MFLLFDLWFLFMLFICFGLCCVFFLFGCLGLVVWYFVLFVVGGVLLVLDLLGGNYVCCWFVVPLWFGTGFELLICIDYWFGLVVYVFCVFGVSAGLRFLAFDFGFRLVFGWGWLFVDLVFPLCCGG